MNDTAEIAPVVDVEAILEDYRRRQMIEHMTGPLISLLVHIVLILLAILFLSSAPQSTTTDMIIEIEEMKIKEIEPKLIQEMEKLEQMANEIVPTVSIPDLPTDNDSNPEDINVTGDFSDDVPQTDDQMDLTSVLDIKPNMTGLTMNNLYGGRTNEGRRGALAKFGGGAKGESAVLRALRWLKKTQKTDGSWSVTQPDSMCGLALLAFLAHGETPASDEFGRTVQLAMQYLSNRVVGSSVPIGAGYTHGIVTYALSESYGMTQVPFVKAAMEKAIGELIAGQQIGGGYDYSYNKQARWDLSVSGWQFQAMKAAYAAGSENPDLEKAIEKSINFLQHTTYKNSSFGYSSPGSGSNAMSGAGVLCLQLLGEDNSKEAKSTIQRMINMNYQMRWANAGSHGDGVYAWYYMTQAMFHNGQSSWRDWNKMFQKVLIDNQLEDGHWEAGKGKDANKGDDKKQASVEYQPYLDTCMCCLMLEVYYRYLPTYKMPKQIVKKTKSTEKFGVDDTLVID